MVGRIQVSEIIAKLAQYQNRFTAGLKHEIKQSTYHFDPCQPVPFPTCGFSRSSHNMSPFGVLIYSDILQSTRMNDEIREGFKSNSHCKLTEYEGNPAPPWQDSMQYLWVSVLINPFFDMTDSPNGSLTSKELTSEDVSLKSHAVLCLFLLSSSLAFSSPNNLQWSQFPRTSMTVRRTTSVNGTRRHLCVRRRGQSEDSGALYFRADLSKCHRNFNFHCISAPNHPGKR